MAFDFYHYPHTDLNQVNFDWIIQQIKQEIANNSSQDTTLNMIMGEQGDPDYYDHNQRRLIRTEANLHPNGFYDLAYTFLQHAEETFYPGTNTIDQEQITRESRGSFLHKEYTPAGAEWGSGSWTNADLAGRFDSNNDPMWPMSCSVLCNAILFGLPWEHTRMATGTPDTSGSYPVISDGSNEPLVGAAILDQQTETDQIQRYQNNKYIGFLRCWELARYLDRLGYLKEITSTDYRELRPGDFILFADSSAAAGFYKGIAHIALFLGWSWESGVLQLITVESDPGNTELHADGGIYTKRRTLAQAAARNLKYYMRFPSPAGIERDWFSGSGTYLPVYAASLSGSTYFHNQIVTITRSAGESPLRPRRAYTCIVDLTDGWESFPGVEGIQVYAFAMDANADNSTQCKLVGSGKLDQTNQIGQNSFAFTYIWDPDGEMGGSVSQIIGNQVDKIKVQFYNVDSTITAVDPLLVQRIRWMDGIAAY